MKRGLQFFLRYFKVLLQSRIILLKFFNSKLCIITHNTSFTIKKRANSNRNSQHSFVAKRSAVEPGASAEVNIRSRTAIQGESVSGFSFTLTSSHFVNSITRTPA